MNAPINLNRARKARAKADAAGEAAANRARYGMSKAEKTVAKTRTEKATRALDAHKREP